MLDPKEEMERIVASLVPENRRRVLLPASVKSKDLSGEIGWRLDELEDKFCDFLRLAPDGRRESLPGGAFIFLGEKQWFMAVSITPQENGVDLDITGSQLLGQCFGEAVHTPPFEAE